MALKFVTKPKTPLTYVETKGPQETPDDIAAAIDQAEALRAKAVKAIAQIKLLQAEVAPYKEALAQVAEMVTKHLDEQGADRDVPAHFYGDTAGVKAGKKTLIRTVKSQALARKLLGQAVYDAKASVPLGVIDQYLTPAQKQTLLDVSYDLRGVELVPKPKSMKD